MYTIEKKQQKKWFIFFGKAQVGGPYRLKNHATEVAWLMNQGMSLVQAEDQVLGI